jgi:capsular polysaccharide biosynthesis protein
MPWSTPSFPRTPQGKQKLRVVKKATLTRVERGPLHVIKWPDEWITGAVYSRNGWLLPMSQKLGGAGGHRVAMADPKRITPERRARRLRGRWLYGGHWMMHFGHFLTETVTTLWPEDIAPVRGLVFHRYLSPNPLVLPWQQHMVDLAGYGGLPIEFVDDKQVRVSELVLPSRTLIQHGWARRGAAAVWQRMADAVPEQEPSWGPSAWPSRVFMSRTAFNEGMRARGRKDPRSTPEHDAMLDELFAAAGFEVVAPETLSIDDQIRLARHARVFAGLAGTALHLACFSPPGAHVLELGDTRSTKYGVRTQRVINTACGHLETFVPPTPGREDLEQRLHELGVWQSDPDPVLLPD